MKRQGNMAICFSQKKKQNKTWQYVQTEHIFVILIHRSLPKKLINKNRSWVRIHLIGNQNFWSLVPAQSDSWVWKALCSLRVDARQFVVCDVGSGTTASFWEDNWTLLGPLIDIVGESGPRISGISQYAMVRDAFSHGDWRTARSRSRNPVLLMLKQCLPPSQPIINSDQDDKYLWRLGDGVPTETFSTSRTWNHLYNQAPEVDWYEAVWFKGRIPKHAFLTWVSARNRLPTRDRMLSWGLQVPNMCVLCNQDT